MRVVNVTRGAVLADRAQMANTFYTRLRGLLGRSGLEPGEGLWLEPCNQVHTHLMGFAIDVAYVDGHGRVVGMARELPPGRFGPRFAGARAVLELPAGTLGATGTREGDRLETHS